jgi:hypothetical protein
MPMKEFHLSLTDNYSATRDNCRYLNVTNDDLAMLAVSTDGGGE